MPGEAAVLLVGDVPVMPGGPDGDDALDVTDARNVETAVRRGDDADVVVAADGAVPAVVEHLDAPVVAVTDDPPAALAGGADEVVSPDADPAVVANRVRTLLEGRRHRRRASEFLDDPLTSRVVVDAEGRVRAANGAALAFAGEERESVLGEVLWDLAWAERSPATAETYRAAVERALAGEQVRERVENRDGQGVRRTVDAVVRPLSDDRVVIEARDVGVLLDEDAALEPPSRRLHTIVENLPIVLFALDGEGKFALAEGRGLANAGLEPDDLVDASVFDLYGDDGAVVDAARQALDGEEVTVTLEVDGRVWDAWAQPVVEDGDVRSVLGAAIDVTDRVERERQLRRQNERLEEFTSVVSHDLRNPLSVARGTADLLADDVDAPELDQLRDSLRRMDDLVEELLELARTGQTVTEFSPVELSGIAADAWSTVDATDAGLAVRTDAVVEADRSRLRQLLENLFRNAVEHAGESPRIEVDDIDDGRGFCVTDDGPGLPEDDRDRVLEYGYTTEADGTGLGLAIARSVAEAHGWKLRLAESEAGGARFEFRGVEPAE